MYVMKDCICLAPVLLRFRTQYMTELCFCLCTNNTLVNRFYLLKAKFCSWKILSQKSSSALLSLKSIWGKIAGSGFINAIKKPPKPKPCKSLVQICICSCVCIYASPVTLFWWIMGTVIWMLGQRTWISYSFLLCQFLHYIMSKMPQYRRVTAL